MLITRKLREKFVDWYPFRARAHQHYDIIPTDLIRFCFLFYFIQGEQEDENIQRAVAAEAQKRQVGREKFLLSAAPVSTLAAGEQLIAKPADDAVTAARVDAAGGGDDDVILDSSASARRRSSQVGFGGGTKFSVFGGKIVEQVYIQFYLFGLYDIHLYAF